MVVSHVVQRGAMLYIRSATPEPAGDVKGQTREVLQRIEGLLRSAGSSKAKLLTAQVRLSDLQLLEDHDAVWNAWIDPKARPVRAWAHGPLRQPEMLVEILVTATK
jgi:enamine deaminase RidA (YjgF/YER057c/UK114 family)